MKFLRTASTRRLLATILGAVAVIAAGTAIAVASSSGGPVPPPNSLAQAVHTGLAAPAPQGIFARIQFTNHLIPSSNIQGSDPLLNGARGRLWLSNNHQMRLELQGDNGDAQVVVNGQSFWVYDPTSKTVYEGKLPADTSGAAGKAKATQGAIPSVAQIQSDIGRLLAHVNLSGAIPGDVAGQPAYTVRISPNHDGGLLGSGELAWDAVRGVPLRVAVYARGDRSPVLELKATDISYGPIGTGKFPTSPPNGAKVVTVSTPGGAAADRGAKAHATKKHAEVTGAAVARHLPFPLAAPSNLVGLRRQSVTLLDWKGSPAALVTYGQNVGAIAVIEQTATKPSASTQTSDHQGLNLPTVSVNGATGQELDTALGTMIRFTRGGVGYTVIGSVPPAAAILAARSL